MLLSRRSLLAILAGLGASFGSMPGGRGVVRAQAVSPDVSSGNALVSGLDEGWVHGVSLLGTPKYPFDFKHFSYVNPMAPKGGKVRLGFVGSFDSLNPFSYKGEPAALSSLVFDTLMTSSLDEPSSAYGLVAESLRIASDYSKVSYKLRPQVRFHDGSVLTAEDVVWSMEALKRAHPQYAFYYKDVTRVEKTGDFEVTFFFADAGNRELPHIVGQLPILSQKWWTSRGETGKQRAIENTTLEFPLGSGPYRLKAMKAGSSIVLERVKDYWGSDLPMCVGHHNFDEVVGIYFTDEQGMLDQFKAGEYDYRLENSAKNWATGYDFPALRQGLVRREEVPSHLPQGMQAFVFNQRRPLFQDARVREAFNWVFDFEWANQNLFYDQYRRTNSYFSNSELAAQDLPSPEELAILTPLKDQIPENVFKKAYACPTNTTSEERRNNLLKAAQLFKEAGFETDGEGVMRDGQARAFSFEILLVSRLFERIVLPFVADLKRLGVQARVRTIDSAQYERRIQSFEYDVIVGVWGQSLSPGNEQRGYWGSAAADRPGSQNYGGIKNPAVDRLIDQLIFSRTREDLIVSCRALDRVLLWNHYVVPMWNLPYNRIAYWSRFQKPDPLPKYGVGFPALWWEDPSAASRDG